MKLFAVIPQILSTVSTQPIFSTVVKWLCILGFFAFVIAGIAAKIRDVESREGIWYCEELKMQISLTDPNDSFLVCNGEKIRCRCEMYYAKHTRGILEVCCQEWEYPDYIHGKVLFAAKIQEYSETSMAVYQRKTNRKYTFVRTDKIG